MDTYLGPVQGALAQISTTSGYKVNVAAIRAADAMLKSLLATIA